MATFKSCVACGADTRYTAGDSPRCKGGCALPPRPAKTADDQPVAALGVVLLEGEALDGVVVLPDEDLPPLPSPAPDPAGTDALSVPRGGVVSDSVPVPPHQQRRGLLGAIRRK